MAAACPKGDETFKWPTTPGKWRPNNTAKWTTSPTIAGKDFLTGVATSDSNTRDYAGYRWQGKTDPTIELGEADYLNVLDFDSGTSETDDASRIQCAIDAARISGIGSVYLPRRTYVLTSALVIEISADLMQSVRIFSDFAVLKAGPGVVSGESMLRIVSNGARVSVENLVLDAGRAFEHGIDASDFNGRGSILRNVRVGFAKSHGIILDKAQGASFRGCSSEYNGGNGWSLGRCTALSLFGCRALRNTGHGFENWSEGGFSGGNFLAHLNAEENGGSGLMAWDSIPTNPGSGLRIRDCVMARNSSHGMQLDAWNVAVSGVTFMPGTNPDARWIWVGSSSSGVVVRDCTIGTSIAAPRFHLGHEGGGRSRHVTFERNYATAAESVVLGRDPASADPSRVAALRPGPDV